MKKTNLLVLYVDQLRKDAIGPYGNTTIITPTLDLLAKDSMVFTNHFCSFPVCTPSRYSFLSGLYASEHCCWTNRSTLAAELPTFPRVLSDNGYHTVTVGKMHLTPTYLDVGFKEMTLSEQDGDGRFEDDYHLYLMDNNQIDGIDVIDQRSEYRKDATKAYFDSFGVEVSDLPQEFHSTTWVTKQALEKLETWKPEGEALMVSYIKPHHPFDPSQAYLDMYKNTEVELLPGYTREVPSWDLSYNQGYFDNTKLDEETAREMTKYYYASITQIDSGIKELIDVLKRKNLYETTQIIFSADHGDFLGFHHLALKQNHMYDPLLAIPLMIKYPGKEPGHCSDLSDNTQVASEIISSLGIETRGLGNSKDLHSNSKYVLAMNRQITQGEEQTCYAVRSSQFKLLMTGTLEDIRLFDVLNDPLELHNISTKKEYLSIIEDMKRFLFNSILFTKTSKNRLEPKAPVVTKHYSETKKQKKALIQYYKDTLSDKQR